MMCLLIYAPKRQNIQKNISDCGEDILFFGSLSYSVFETFAMHMLIAQNIT